MRASLPSRRGGIAAAPLGGKRLLALWNPDQHRAEIFVLELPDGSAPSDRDKDARNDEFRSARTRRAPMSAATIAGGRATSRMHRRIRSGRSPAAARLHASDGLQHHENHPTRRPLPPPD